MYHSTFVLVRMILILREYTSTTPPYTPLAGPYATLAGPQYNPRRIQSTRNQTMITSSVNINDSTQDFTGQILRGEKSIETRDTLNNALQGVLGQRVGITRTGTGNTKVVGYATVAMQPVVYSTEAEFRQDETKHLVKQGSKYDIKPGKMKFGYVLTDVVAVEPFTPKSVGRKYSTIG